MQYLIQHSAACTIMNKMKINSRAQVFKKYGYYLTVEKGFGRKKDIKLDLQRSLSRINKFQTGAKLPYYMFNLAIQTHQLLEKACAICGTSDNVEMYHRRPLNTLKGINVNLSRKQIALCRQCDMKVHRGEYNGPGIY